MQKINLPLEKNEEIEIPLNDIVSAKIEELKIFQNQIITIENAEIIRQELETVSSIIQDIHVMKENEPQNFAELKFEFNNVKLLHQRYEIEEEIIELNQISKNIKRDLIILEEKQKDIKEEQKNAQVKQEELAEKNKKIEDSNNNLAYNILGFIVSFSIISASVEAISRINGTINILLFMTFTILLLLTALIALHNFYKNDNKRENRLQDNYFLWKAVVGIMVILFIILGIKTIEDNKENIFNYLDTKIEEVIEEKVNQKINNEELAPN